MTRSLESIVQALAREQCRESNTDPDGLYRTIGERRITHWQARAPGIKRSLAASLKAVAAKQREWAEQRPTRARQGYVMQTEEMIRTLEVGAVIDNDRMTA